MELLRGPCKDLVISFFLLLLFLLSFDGRDFFFSENDILCLYRSDSLSILSRYLPASVLWFILSNC